MHSSRKLAPTAWGGGAFVLVGLFASPSALADYPIASHRYLADPASLVHDGRVYLYCSNDDDNVKEDGSDDGYKMASIVAVSSSDMKNWTDHGEVLRVPRDVPWAGNSWAPAVVERDGTVYMYFGNNGSGIGVASSDSPTGPFTDPKGSALVTASTPGASGPDMWLFDPGVFVDDDGQAYLYFGGNGERNARVIKLNDDMVSVSGSATALTVPYFFEASWMHKRDGVYYLSYSTNPANGLRIDYLTSTSPTSGFTHRGTAGPQPPKNDNNNHAAIFEFGGSWYHAYHNRSVATDAGEPTGYRRNLALESLTYEADGSIVPVTYTTDGIEQVGHLDPYVRVEAETFNVQSGIETEPCEEGGMNLAQINDGDWVRLRGVDFGEGAESFRARVASAAGGGSIELRLDAPDGVLVGTCAVEATGAWQEWSDTSCGVDGATGVHDLYLVFTGGESYLFNVNFWQFSPVGGGGAGGGGTGGGTSGNGGGVGSGSSGGSTVGTGGASPDPTPPAQTSGGTSGGQSSDEAGCGCRSASRAPSGNALVLTALLAASLGLRRRGRTGVER
ncbi:carbohydrate-binding protein [Sorangium cellulosum]|uniref:Carbohydrate-binding protein n=1 Tax=Sorangium cellulosum TaxID=56 RepID=A0A2L0EYM3_SORCE|nr:glycoside hydrolase family 43 protein [Sorangium cellulosum]AUX44339.1 carbohydrate-binding protein [Sorangium cellulosum]